MTIQFFNKPAELIETGLNRIKYNLKTEKAIYSVMVDARRSDVFIVMDKSSRKVGTLQIRDGICSQVFNNEVSNK